MEQTFDWSPSRTLGVFTGNSASLGSANGAHHPDAINSRLRVKTVRQLIRARRQRSEFFRTSLFADPAWDILLELFACDLAQRRISVSAVVAASAVPGTTGLRWMNALLEEGLIARRPDPCDGRRVFVEMSDRGRKLMKAYFSSLPANVQPI